MGTKLKSGQFMRADTFPFWIRRCVHDFENVPPIHGHDFIELIYVAHGEARHYFEGRSYEIGAGDVFIINPGEMHTYQMAPGQHIEIINCLFLPHLIQDTWLRELGVTQSMDFFYVHPFLDREERFHHRLNLRGQSASLVLTLLEGMVREFEARQAGFATLVRLKLVELLILLSRFYTDTRRKNGKVSALQQDRQVLVRRICGYLERHHDQKISIQSLADLFNLSTRQLSRVFKEEADMTVLDMVHRIRIEKAKYWLDQSDEKVVNIAMKVGYEDQAFFSRLFRRQVGCSPGHYRKQS